jgi:ABC-type amino acid transport substrate-binding protein
VVGIPARREPFGEFTKGFGALVADALGVEATFEELPPERLLTAPDADEVDISFPLIAVTEKLVRRFAFTDPIYVAHQRLLVQADSGVEEVTDLNGTVCQFITREVHKLDRDTFVLSPIGVNVKELNPDVVVIEPPRVEGCLEDLAKGRVEAIAAADWLLYPALARTGGLEIVGDDLTTEAYAAVVQSEASSWADLVNGVLAEADSEGDWQRIYTSAFGDLVEEEVTFPDMTVEEAAALFPSDL